MNCFVTLSFHFIFKKKDNVISPIFFLYRSLSLCRPLSIYLYPLPSKASIGLTLLGGILAIMVKSTLVPNETTQTAIALAIAVIAILSTFMYVTYNKINDIIDEHDSCVCVCLYLYLCVYLCVCVCVCVFQYVNIHTTYFLPLTTRFRRPLSCTLGNHSQSN
jgi:uncharacterized membrane protein YidH (DUF202 family)